MPWTVAHQAPLPMGFSGQEYWNVLPFPSPRDLPNPGLQPESPALQADSLPLSHLGNPLWIQGLSNKFQRNPCLSVVSLFSLKMRTFPEKSFWISSPQILQNIHTENKLKEKWSNNRKEDETGGSRKGEQNLYRTEWGTQKIKNAHTLRKKLYCRVYLLSKHGLDSHGTCTQHSAPCKPRDLKASSVDEKNIIPDVSNQEKLVLECMPKC